MAFSDKKKMKKTAKSIRTRAKAFVLLFVLTLSCLTLTSCGDDADFNPVDRPMHDQYSWVRGADTYSTSPLVTGEVSTDESEDAKTAAAEAGKKAAAGQKKTSAASRLFGEMMVGLGDMLNGFLKKDGRIDASASGIIMGKIVNGNNYFAFDLSQGNVWGVFGAAVYVVCRILALIIVFCLVLWALVRNVWTSGSGKGLQDLKNTIYSAVIFIILLFIMPFIADWLCELRDALSVVFYRLVSGELYGLSSVLGAGVADNSNGLSYNVTDYFYQMFKSNRSATNGLLYLAACLIPFSYLVSYILIAVNQTFLFGTFPIFCGVGVKDRSMLDNWCSVFFSNIFIPAIDTVMVLFPAVMKQLLNYAVTGNANENTFFGNIFVIVCMMGAIPARNALLRLFGNMFGASFVGGQGLAGMLAFGAATIGAARRMAGGIGGGKGGNGSGNGDKVTGKDVKNSDKTIKEEGKTLADEAKKLRDPLAGKPGQEGASGEKKQLGDWDKGTGTGQGQNGSGIGTGTGTGDDKRTGGLGGSGNPVSAGEGDADEKVKTEEKLGENPGESDDGKAKHDGVEEDNGAMHKSVDDLNEENGKEENNNSSQDNSVTESNTDIDNNGIANDIREEADAIYGKGDSEEKDAFMNMAANRADNLEKADQLQQASNDIDKADAASRSKIEKNNTELENLKRDNARKDSPELRSKTDHERAISDDQYRQNKTRIEELEQANRQEKEKMAERAQTKQSINESLQQRRDIEDRYAKAYGHAGMNDQKFKSAAEMKQATQYRNRQREVAGYKNFKSKDMQGVLSPREKQRYQGRATVAAAARTGSKIAATTAAAAAAGTVAAVASAYGGGDAMRGAMSAGAVVGGATVSAGYATYDGVQTIRDNHQPKVTKKPVTGKESSNEAYADAKSYDPVIHETTAASQGGSGGPSPKDLNPDNEKKANQVPDKPKYPKK